MANKYGAGTGDLSDAQMGELHTLDVPPKTDQFWAGDFGNRYTERNQGPDILAARIAMFSRILERAPGVNSVIELGANIGINLQAIRALRPHAKLWGVEVNEEAALKIPVGQVIIGSILDFKAPEPCDLAFTRGVLIHVAPEDLPRAYDALYHASRRYIMVAEYFNPTPTMVPYRGHNDRLWKRDFAGELLDRFPGLMLTDCAFIYSRGDFAQDCVTWFLMEKRGGKAYCQRCDAMVDTIDDGETCARCKLVL